MQNHLSITQHFAHSQVFWPSSVFPTRNRNNESFLKIVKVHGYIRQSLNTHAPQPPQGRGERGGGAPSQTWITIMYNIYPLVKNKQQRHSYHSYRTQRKIGALHCKGVKKLGERSVAPVFKKHYSDPLIESNLMLFYLIIYDITRERKDSKQVLRGAKVI